jgi:hypothetical protein
MESALPSEVESSVRGTSKILAAEFQLRWAELVFFYNTDNQELTFGSIHAFSSRTGLSFGVAEAAVQSLSPNRDQSWPKSVLERPKPRLTHPMIPRSDRHRAVELDLHDGTEILPKPRGILIVAAAEDPTVVHFRNYAEAHHVPVTLWDIASLGAFSAEKLSPANLREVTGIWLRPFATSDSHLWHLLSWLEDLLAFVPVPVVGNTLLSSSNASKPLHTSIISAHARERVRAISSYLCSSVDRTRIDRVVKAISSEKVEVRLLRDLPWSDGIYPVPIHVQDFVAGFNIRVQVSGSRAHAVRIDSSRLDYRFDPDFHVSPVELPAEVSDWCVQSAAWEGAVFAGIDLLKPDREDVYYCLEINPQPGYHVFEERLLANGGKPTVSEWLVELLAGRG